MLKRKASTELEANGTKTKEQMSSSRTTVDPEGDLVLVVEGSELLVSRNVLCLSSSVFRAMLRKGSPFLESNNQTRSSDGFQLIHLEDDDFEILSIVANVIHVQHDKVPNEVSFRILDALAIVCDKYDLRKCLGLWPQKWSEPYLDKVWQPGFERWLFIAMVFRNGPIFSETSKRLIMNTVISDTGDLQTGGSVWSTEGVPSGILEQIKALRRATFYSLLCLCRFNLDRLIHNPETPICSQPERPMLCDAVNIGTLMQAIPELSKPQSEDHNYEGTVGDLCSRMRSISWYGAQITCAHKKRSKDVPPPALHAQCGLSQTMAVRMTSIVTSLQGLSLPSETTYLGNH